jgi:hypothetical protein
MKNIKAKIKFADCITQTRLDIAAMQKILDKFATEDGFEEYCDKNSIKLSVGGDEVDLYFAPRTWEAAEQFLMFCICHLIESDGLDEYPIYDEMLTRYAAALGEERGSFE